MPFSGINERIPALAFPAFIFFKGIVMERMITQVDIYLFIPYLINRLLKNSTKYHRSAVTFHTVNAKGAEAGTTVNSYD